LNFKFLTYSQISNLNSQISNLKSKSQISNLKSQISNLNSQKVKQLRKWMRILHRDIGFFFVGTSLIYGFSGIALNHLKDWNPSYYVSTKDFTFEENLSKTSVTKEKVLTLVDQIDDRDNYKSHYYPDTNILKIFLAGGSSAILDVESHRGTAEFLNKRPVFYHVNYLHYNPNEWWKWFSDIFAVSLIFLAVSSLFMIKGNKGLAGRGGIYVALGILIPLLLLFLF